VRTVVVPAPGGVEQLHLAEVSEPEAGPGELLVRTEASGVNFIDVYRRTGAYPIEYPHTPGIEGAGTVIALGHGVASFRVGQRVTWVWVPGSYAEVVRVPESSAILVPDEISSSTAAAVLLQGMTAQFLVDSSFPVAAGQDVLIHAAAGGVGLLLSQLASQRGARVIGTVSSHEKETLARRAGVKDVIRYDELTDIAAQLPEIVRDLTGGRGVHVAYDGVGRATFDASLASLRAHGVMILFGQASGPVPPFDLTRLNSGGSLYVTRPNLIHFTGTREDLEAVSGKILSAVAAGTLDVQVSGTFALEEAGSAHQLLEGRRSTGKVLIEHGGD
jgi:NADPH2:quinone reductase